MRLKASFKSPEIDSFIEFLKQNGWTEIERERRLESLYVDLIAKSPENVLHAYEFVSIGTDYTTEDVEAKLDRKLIKIVNIGYLVYNSINK